MRNIALKTVRFFGLLFKLKLHLHEQPYIVSEIIDRGQGQYTRLTVTLLQILRKKNRSRYQGTRGKEDNHFQTFQVICGTLNTL